MTTTLKQDLVGYLKDWLALRVDWLSKCDQILNQHSTQVASSTDIFKNKKKQLEQDMLFLFNEWWEHESLLAEKWHDMLDRHVKQSEKWKSKEGHAFYSQMAQKVFKERSDLKVEILDVVKQIQIKAKALEDLAQKYNVDKYDGFFKMLKTLTANDLVLTWVKPKQTNSVLISALRKTLS